MLSSLSFIASRTGLSLRKANQARNQYFQTGRIKTTAEWRCQKNGDNDIIKLSKKFQQAGKIIVSLLQKNPSISAAAILKELSKKQMLVKPRSINYILHQQGYIYKRLDYNIFSKNTVEVIKERFQYTEQLKDYNIDQVVFVSETTFNASNSVFHGWIKKNDHNLLKAPQNPNNISAIAVASIKGIICYFVKRGPIEAGEIFNLLIDNILPVINQTDALIVGNLKIGSANEIKGYFRDHNLVVKDLPSYSPQLNPLESFYSQMKIWFRREREEKRIKDPQEILKMVNKLFEEYRNSSLQDNFKKMKENFRVAQRKEQLQHHF